MPFNLVFPEDCRVCNLPLQNISRVPVCVSCLGAPQPLLPEYFCAQCHSPFVNASPLDESGRCRLCRSGLIGFDRAWSWGEYDGPLRRLIQLYKYNKVKSLAPYLGEWLSLALPRDAGADTIVPMPLHWYRYWRRGFNQAELLARVLGRKTGLPVVTGAVARRKSTSPQAGLTAALRRENVSGAFLVKRRHLIEGRRIVLVDDVLTTGATAATCAAVLRKAGARDVSVLTVARADRRRGFTGLSLS